MRAIGTIRLGSGDRVTGTAEAVTSHSRRSDGFDYVPADTAPARTCLQGTQDWPWRPGDRAALQRTLDQDQTECRIEPAAPNAAPLAVRTAHGATAGRHLTTIVNERRKAL